jgi:transcriptional regulator with XRE-family HTH domain
MSSSRRRADLVARRRQVGLTQEMLAEVLDVTPAAVSSWERGSSNPSARHRQPLADALRIDLTTLDRLIDPTTPVRVEQHTVDHWLDLYESLVQGAGAIRQVAKVAVPALLQTRRYAEFTERNTHLPVTEDYIAERIELRLARQKVLQRRPEPLEYQALIDEPLLMPPIGGPSVMAEQLDHLDAMFHEPNIDIRILPLNGRSMLARGGFELVTKEGRTRPFLAITFDLDQPRYEQRPALLADFAAMYDYLYGFALSPADSLARIRQHLRSHQ